MFKYTYLYNLFAVLIIIPSKIVSRLFEHLIIRVQEFSFPKVNVVGLI